MIKAVIFDLDNTLVDFMKMKRLSIEAALTAMIDAGLQLSLAEASAEIDKIYKEQGIEYQQVFDLFLTQQLGMINHKILSSGIVAYRKAREANLIPYPHVYSSLNQLVKMGIKLGILSDAPSKEAWLRLAYLNFHHIFDEVVTFDDTGERKPSPVPFMAILRKLGVEPAEAVMVGDWAERDIVGASNVGIKTAFAKYGDTFNTPFHNADYELNDFSEILEIIKKENS
ncbi:MAG: TIGR02253 family HAD-type hydrolase [Ignavibacteriales bacterium]|jgi:putative hydrolase of the HAD superfamily|nr:TIGR02253 family HAD-type hydrolase [Ignavibacteriales bacterium]MBK7266963.1 TIGR02253 family HAD-type hydrolase [Ignavibacteriales bacterium]MBP9124007.1 TIGR02253 family HAD-type hydrolase [Ignavibacteriaceae bacterium]MCC6637599.1 TIGR02253 family HAD-type hydrolase [Ignavibacteriaceae bacterium]